MAQASTKNSRNYGRAHAQVSVEIVPLQAIYNNNLCVAFEKTPLRLKCDMMDISVTGCRLVGPDTEDIGRQFYLYAHELELAWKCQTVWRNAGMIGARFQEAADLSEPKPKFVPFNPYKTRQFDPLARLHRR